MKTVNVTLSDESYEFLKVTSAQKNITVAQFFEMVAEGALAVALGKKEPPTLTPTMQRLHDEHIRHNYIKISKSDN